MRQSINWKDIEKQYSSGHFYKSWKTWAWKKAEFLDILYLWAFKFHAQLSWEWIVL